MSDSVSKSSELPVSASPRARLDIVRGAGRWMPWAGLVLAILWWGALAVALVTVFDLNVIASQPPITLAGGAMIAILPGLLILMASFMARESARGAAANTLVLDAATQLLDPSEASLRKAEAFAARMTASAEEVERAFDQVVATMKAIAGEIGDERLRLESVSYAAADNARDLAQQLAAERTSLEGLIRDLRAQGDTMNEAIPRQAEKMVQSARAAAAEIERADEALDQRLSAMRVSTDALSTELSRLNALAGTASAQSDAVLQSVADVEARLEHAHALVDEAISASDSAVKAAADTGASLRAAVSSALDDARRASIEIQARTREASEDAARQMGALRQSAESAGEALKMVGVAARAETDMTEHRLGQTTSALQRSVSGNGAEAGMDLPEVETPPPAPGRDHPTHSPLFAAPPARLSASSEPAREPVAPVSAPAPRAPMPVQQAQPSRPAAPTREVEEELFDGPSSESAPNGAGQSSSAGASMEVSSGESHEQTTPPPFDPLEDPDEIESAPETPPNSVQEPARLQNGREEAGWSSILNDMDREEAGEMTREETAETVIRRLESAGVHLANVFRPKDKKKIAQAARKGEQQRRLAIQSAARNELERVARRVRGDDGLSDLAKEFVTMEAPDAIAALERTHATNRNASPRLSAFLLLDAAIGG
ncbi:MAG: hypothetical protein MRY64_10005 [Hyphomonadaceae bacterium]|nr:hypothetical protein [Hyphomonadaceae bacterium]